MFDTAILLLESEIERQGLAKAGTSYWMVRQANSLGLSFLRKCRDLKFTTPEEVDTFRKKVRSEMMGVKDDE